MLQNTLSTGANFILANCKIVGFSSKKYDFGMFYSHLQLIDFLKLFINVSAVYAY